MAWRRPADLRQAIGYAVAGRHREAAGFHGAREPLQERLVVLHDQERAIGVAGQFGYGVHDSGFPWFSDTPSYGVTGQRCQGHTFVAPASSRGPTAGFRRDDAGVGPKVLVRLIFRLPRSVRAATRSEPRRRDRETSGC